MIFINIEGRWVNVDKIVMLEAVDGATKVWCQDVEPFTVAVHIYSVIEIIRGALNA